MKGGIRVSFLQARPAYATMLTHLINKRKRKTLATNRISFYLCTEFLNSPT